MSFVPSCGIHDRTALIETISGRRVVVSVSGGKDSAATSLYLQRVLGLEVENVFQDTGWEHEKTYEYLRGPLAAAIGPIREIKSEKYPGGMAEMVVKRGTFPSRLRRFCTQELKVFPMRDYLRSLHIQGIDTINVVGIRAEESKSRAQMVEWEDNPIFDCEVWRPLIRWTIDDVIAIHLWAGLAPNPLYLQGALRVGCWPCIFARKAEIRMVAETDPARIERLQRLEGEVGGVAGAPRAWFTDRYNQKSGRPVPIMEAVAWSKTSTRGVEPEPFDDPMRECVRWGMCEANPDSTAGTGGK